MKKKKVLIHSDFPLAKTGFGKNCRNIMEYLYKTNKYELINLAVGSLTTNPQELERTPWKTIGTVNPEKIQKIHQQNDPKNWDAINRMAGYGAYAIDEVIMQEKPDVVISIQDIWGIDFSVEKEWFKKTTSVLWTTLDSLPILDKAIVAAQKTKHFWSWADFATKAMHKMGLKHVKTVRGSLNVDNFYRLSDQERLQLRQKLNIDKDTFLIGFVFRNQLRKSVPNLIQGFKIFKQNNPKLKTKLLLHTSWSEGWNIPKLLNEHGVPMSDILTTYACRSCGKYEIKSFLTNDENCNFCRTQKSQTTTGPGFGVNEFQLNEIYNLMDVYCHPFTSGGQEIPIQEAKLTELITLVTNYSCGEDSCEFDAGSLALDWAEYREPDTMFIKSSTYPSSIAKQLNKVLEMKPEARKELGKKARQWVINNFSIEVIGKHLEDFIDSAPQIVDESIFENKENPNPNAKIPNIKDDGDWIISLYQNILDRKDVDKNDDGYKHWMARINKELNREQIDQYFRQVAFQKIQEKNGKTKTFEDLLDANDKGRVIVVQPEGAEDIYLLTSLFKSIKENYPEWSLYVSTKPEYKDLIDGNPYVHKWIEFSPIMDNIVFLEGNNTHKGYFDVAYLPYLNTQKMPSFMHNGIDKMSFSLNH
jgi:glycosyltransferase involved in cell wall biosynthesis